jgi:integrase
MSKRLSPRLDPEGRLTSPWVSEDGITVRPPSARDIARGKPYHRIVYYDGGGTRRFASGGRTFQESVDALPVIRKRMASQMSRELRPVQELVDAFLADNGLSPRGWSAKHKSGQAWLMKHYVLPTWGTMPCGQVTARKVKELVLSAPTSGEQRRLRSAVSGLHKYAYAEDWTTDEAAALLKTTNLRVQAAPGEEGQDGQVSEAEVPTHDEVGALAARVVALERAPDWYALLIMIPAYTGLRLGEVLGLRKKDVDLVGRRLHVRRQVTEVDGKPLVGPPKRGSSRVTVIPRLTPGSTAYPEGFPLLEALTNRVMELENDEAPLFPAPRGGHWRRSNFSRRVFIPAATAAGWRRDQGGNVVLKYHSLRHRFCTWMLWERNKSAQDVAVVAGHKDVSITLKIYSGDDGHALDRIDDEPQSPRGDRC